MSRYLLTIRGEIVHIEFTRIHDSRRIHSFHTGKKPNFFQVQGAMGCKVIWTEYVYIWDIKRAEWEWMNNPSPTWFKLCGTEQVPLKPLASWKAEREETAE
jgi:hypothetical protein